MNNNIENEDLNKNQGNTKVNQHDPLGMYKTNSSVIFPNTLIYNTNASDFNEKTVIVYGEEKTTELILKVLYNSKHRWDNYANSKGPTIAMGIDQLRKGMKNAYNRGVRIRYISEITKDNIRYCKDLMEIAELRHLDESKGGMAINETQYIATAYLQETKPVAHLIYSNVKEIVEQQQLVFDTLWGKAIPAEYKIKEIEEGIEPVKTKVLENQEEIRSHLSKTIKISTGRLVCSSIGGMQMIHDNFFDLYKDVVERQKRGESSGIKWLTFVDNNKNSIKLVKAFLDAGIQVRHIKNLPSMNFSVDSKSLQATIEAMDKGKMISSMLISNEPTYVNHFTSYFQNLWNNYSIKAEERIKNLEEGTDYYIEVIRYSYKTWELYLDVIKSAQNEIFFIFPTPRAFIRQLKAIYLAKLVSRDRKAKVRILTPSNELVEENITSLLEEDKEEKIDKNEKKVDQKRSESDQDSFFNSDIKIRYIEKMYNTKATIVVVDRKQFLVMELRDDTKDTFIEAIGQSIHSTSKAGVLSYVAIFENLWRQSELYHELKESNENLRIANEQLKINDKMQNEFINTAAHELKTPLQPILSLSDYLGNRIKDEKQQDMLKIIYKKAKKLSNLTRDILDVTKIEGKKLNLNKESFCIVDLVKSVIKDFEYERIHGKKIKFELHFNAICSDLIVFADRNRIAQVISNLIDNSIKFILTENGNEDGIGLISINMEIEKINRDKINEINNIVNKVVITIKDNGEGIDPEIFPRLFTKFASKSFQGTGLGLYISKNIVEAHGGKICAVNNKEEKGATFSFSIPIVNILQ